RPAQLLQQFLVDRHDIGVLPEARAVVFRGRKQFVAHFRAQQVEAARDGGRAAAMRAEHEDDLAHLGDAGPPRAIEPRHCRRHDTASTLRSGSTWKSTVPVAMRSASCVTRNISTSMIRSRYVSPSGSAAVTPAFMKYTPGASMARKRKRACNRCPAATDMPLPGFGAVAAPPSSRPVMVLIIMPRRTPTAAAWNSTSYV